jgi:predicted nucleic acid-binding protein
MKGVDFLDTNILVYAMDEAEPSKRAIAEMIVAEARSLGTGIISAQVVQEILNVATRKFKTILNKEDTEMLLRDVWMPMLKVMPSYELLLKAHRLHHRYQFSFYDSLIIAAAQTAGCKRLLTEDLQHGQDIDGLKIVNPFI